MIVEQAIIKEWLKDRKILADGRVVQPSDDCLVKPEANDLVLIMANGPGATVTLIAILERPDPTAPLELKPSTSIDFKAHRITLEAKKMQVNAINLLSSAQDHYLVEDTHTEISKLKVSRSDVIIKQRITSEHQIGGVRLQRLGHWLSNTTNDVRMKAKSFLFE